VKSSAPSKIEIVGNTLSIIWPDGKESFLDAPELRSQSPSAENKGETDIFGNISGGQPSTEHKNVLINKFVNIGNYAIRIHVSDGHSTGIYSWDYLKELDSESFPAKGN